MGWERWGLGIAVTLEGVGAAAAFPRQHQLPTVRWALLRASQHFGYPWAQSFGGGGDANATPPPPPSTLPIPAHRWD